MKRNIFIVILIFSLFLFTCENQYTSAQPESDDFMLGNETLLNINVDWISGSRLALITNNSGVLSDGTMLIDAISSVQGIEVVKVFSPEHGFRGDDRNDDYIDEKTGLRIVTLYGNKKKPTQSDLSNVDILIYDIQDVGARFYTYINTMFYCIEAAVKHKVT